ncbi:hypothetical protein W97_00767 [Coniosporium apollinis CBS 100218]|uniref:Uncharacterized protein n=1 Tax=Coniosporium apollinis (strain CBS 100218) TaxID=1168221 RepID=R7YI25_CONA1|nr:uncharacterized protein W97_00767 [Coniosporium apollinis CBS 100218]EON61552.1 hypothetical protein W97_00767 [Coniosporium apollinis CBS 100218]
MTLSSREERMLDSPSSSSSNLSSSCSANAMIIDAINGSLRHGANGALHHVFDGADLQRLHHFQTITVCTLATSSISRVYQAEIVKLACLHPHLLHAVLTIAEMHYRYTTSDRASPAELYHWQKTTSLFNQKLAHPIKTEDADAVFATSTLLNGISMGSIETDQYLDAWPLKPSSHDLQWLRMQGGIKLMVLAAQPWRKGSVFENLISEGDDGLSTFTDTRLGIAGIPAPFVSLCDLSVLSTVENNPYHAQVRMLCPLLSMECTRETLMEHLNFIAEMRPEFLELLQQRDARALLILGYCRMHGDLLLPGNVRRLQDTRTFGNPGPSMWISSRPAHGYVRHTAATRT